MDPNTTLQALRVAVKLMDDAPNQFAEATIGRQIAEHFESLDRWIRNGGFLPADWVLR